MSNRRVTIQTPLGDQLKFRLMNGTEEISTLFALDVDLLSESKSIDPKALLGKSATVEIEMDGGGKRYIDGIVTRFGMQGQDFSKYSYRLLLRPWFWLATRKTNFKIFQFKTVPDIIDEVLGSYGYPFEKKLTRAYRSWDYCVQYYESDHNFLARLCELEGIYYYFTHSSGQHTLVFADDIVGSHQPLPGGASIPFYPPEKAAVHEKECIYSWQLGQEIHSGRHFNDDYDFKKPRADLSNMRQMPPGHAHDQFERYEWPGGYTEFTDGETYARIRLEEQLSPRSRVMGVSNHRGLAPGYTTTLTNYPREDQNQQYLLLSVHYHFEENAEVSEGISGSAGASQVSKGSIQRLTLTAQPTSVVYRPQRVTPKPRTQGPQTAVVVGPPGEEIWVDKFGRVKVQFHWDRIGAMDENSSCWVRVSSTWAGSNFGGIFIPRIGMEVIIDHLNGDPDYPILTGVVYNANNMPPWDLPANATQSGWKTKSSKGGAPGAGLKNGPGDANVIRFEDKAGAEQLWLHAQKDQLTEVENDEDKWVGHDRRKNVDHDETTVIGNDRTETVMHDETITVHNNRTERVDVNEKISIGVNRDEDVGVNETVTIGVNRTKTIGVNETDTIGTKWGISVGKIKTETIGLFSMQNIGIANMQNIGVARMTNIGVAYNLNVGMFMMTNVGMNQSTTVGMDRTVTVSKNQTTKVGKKYAITAGDELSITVGAASLVMKKDGTITINGKDISVKASGDITEKASGNIIIKGSQTDVN